MSKINLVPDIRLEKIKVKRMNFLVTFFSCIVVAVLVLLLVLLQSFKFIQQYSLEKTNKDISANKEELKQYADIETMQVNIEQGLKAVDEISKREPRWSKFLPELEKATPNDIRFTEFSQDGSTFKAQVEGRNVTSIARLINSLEKYKYKGQAGEGEDGQTLFKNVKVTGYSKDTTGLVKFEVSFDMEEGLLW